VTGRSDDGKIFMSVRDNGTGVPDDFKEKIFEKFAQAPNAKERATRKGTGLGLAFCRLVVELHSGKIWVQDTPEGGSEFILWIPLR
jgi:signal transduction histidine kinase